MVGKKGVECFYFMLESFFLLIIFFVVTNFLSCSLSLFLVFSLCIKCLDYYISITSFIMHFILFVYILCVCMYMIFIFLINAHFSHLPFIHVHVHLPFCFNIFIFISRWPSVVHNQLDCASISKSMQKFSYSGCHHFFNGQCSL